MNRRVHRLVLAQEVLESKASRVLRSRVDHFQKKNQLFRLHDLVHAQFIAYLDRRLACTHRFALQSQKVEIYRPRPVHFGR